MFNKLTSQIFIAIIVGIVVGFLQIFLLNLVH